MGQGVAQQAEIGEDMPQPGFQAGETRIVVGFGHRGARPVAAGIN